MSGNNYTDILLEDINSKFDAVLDAVSGMQDSVKKIPKMSERLEKLESDIAMVRLATKATSGDVNIIKIRTEKLEDIREDLVDLQKRVKTLEAT